VKTQFKILLFMVCVNLGIGLVFAFNVAGTEYVGSSTSPTNASQYESHFNATNIAESWGATPFSGIPVIGDIFAGFQFFFSNIQFLIDGFPMFLTWIGDTFVADATAQAGFSILAMVLRAIEAILISVLLIEFISGRYLTD